MRRLRNLGLLTAVAGLCAFAVFLLVRPDQASAPAGPGAVPGGATRLPSGGGPATPGLPSLTGRHRPNIVFVLTDDLSLDLLRFMPHVQAMELQGTTFRNYFVSDSLCCPSRASILTGDFPHDTGVFNNVGHDGGYGAFFRHHEEARTFAVYLQRQGYETGFMGKYLNGYLQNRGSVRGLAKSYFPRSWSEWDVAGWGYPEFDYRLNEDGTLRYYGHRPSDYLTDVLAREGVQFIGRAAAERRPFFLELATFAPHAPYTPAPRDAHDFPGLNAPRPPNFDRLPTNPPRWLADHRPLTPVEIASIDRIYRLRAQDVQSVDQMIGAIERELVVAGVSGNTYLVFSSDNGLHTGEYRLTPGKMTAFDTDIHVPLVVVGPGVRPDTGISAMTENIDLAETFAAIGGARLRGDGRSLLPLLEGRDAAKWRNAILVEHHGPDLRGIDPDFQQPASGNPRSYEALRTDAFLYVLYRDGEREFYDLRRDPFELDNLAPSLTRAQRRALDAADRAIKRCHGPRSCWRAMHVHAPPGLP